MLNVIFALQTFCTVPYCTHVCTYKYKCMCIHIYTYILYTHRTVPTKTRIHQETSVRFTAGLCDMQPVGVRGSRRVRRLQYVRQVSVWDWKMEPTVNCGQARTTFSLSPTFLYSCLSSVSNWHLAVLMVCLCVCVCLCCFSYGDKMQVHTM